MVLAMSKRNMNAGIPIMFQSYKTTNHQGPDCTIWEALYATMAHPSLFESIEIGEHPLRHSFVGGEVGCSNPTAYVLAEVKRIYPDRQASCILSIGAGRTRTIRIHDPSLSQRMFHTEELVAMKDMVTDSERVAEEMAFRFQRTAGVYFRFNVDQGMQGIGTGDLERLDDVGANTRAYLRRAETNQIMELTVQAIKKREPTLATVYIGRCPIRFCLERRPNHILGASRQDGQISERFAEQPARVKRCPAPTPVFTGRQTEITQIENCIIGSGSDAERRVCVVHGLGGAGKTQLALKVIERTQYHWTHVVYVDASSVEAIEGTLQDFAKAKDIGKSHDDVVDWLGSLCDRWLVIFDNVDDPSLNIRDYFPRGAHGSILVTTRLTDLALLARGPTPVCHISSMSEPEGLALLLKSARLQDLTLTDSEREAAISLLQVSCGVLCHGTHCLHTKQDFGYLALAIVHAGAYIGHSPAMSILTYRRVFLEQRQRTLELYHKLEFKLDDYGKTVYTTWKMCYNLLKQSSRPFLWLVTFLHHDGITEDIFRRAAANMHLRQHAIPPAEVELTAREHVQQWLSLFLDSDGHWDTLRFSEVMGELSSYSLIEFDRMNLAYRVHVLVQDWASTEIPQTQELALECTTALLSLSIDNDDTMESHSFRRTLGLHVTSLLSKKKDKISANHGQYFARVCYETGQWDREEALNVQVQEAMERELGETHPETLISMVNLGCTYMRQGHWSKTESLQARAASTFKEVLGEEHPLTLAVMGNLASTYVHQERWDSAESLQLQILDTYRQTLGDGHTETLRSMNNLASIYMSRCRWADAEPLQLQVLSALRRTMGEEHPKTLVCMNNLAAIYSYQYRWDDAESLQVQVLNARKKVLGQEHPDTLLSMSSLAFTCQVKGRWSEAEALSTEAFRTLERTLGNQHSYTLIAKECLRFAQVYHRLIHVAKRSMPFLLLLSAVTVFLYW